MKTKICTNCKKKYPTTLKYWHKQKNGKHGLKSICKTCSCIASKEYRNTPKGKENKRISEAKWRKKNPEKILEINHRCYQKHKNKYNAKKREQFKNDPEYRQKVYEREKRYVESGRRHEINSKPENREKSRIRSKKRRMNPEKKEHDYKRNAQWREQNRDHLIKLHKKRRQELALSYVAQTMKVSVKDVDPKILETKKLIIELRRELKSNVKIM